jgi:dCMP deaminase
MDFNQEKWDLRFLGLAEEIAQWSKDPSRKVGAIAVDAKHNVLSIGYNGFPRNIDDAPSKYLNADIKARLVVHAETNLIYNATYSGVCLDGATLYVYGLPVCGECAKAIAQVGIKRVVSPDDLNVPEKWACSTKNSLLLFNEIGIQYDFIENYKPKQRL